MSAHDHGDGLHEDLAKLATRRDALRIFGAGSAAALLTTFAASNAPAATPTGEVPDETAGPYPGDGSNGPDILDDSGIVRHDIRRSFGERRTLAKGPIVKTSQIALPAAASRKVYATSGYSGSTSNLARTSLSSDNVFRDDKAIHQLATVTGSVKRGYVANLTIGI